MKLRLEQRIFLRSLCWQTSWNFARMQCLGLAYAIYPLLEKLYGKNSEHLARRTRRYMVCFNTNPYMAAAILGFMVHMERQGEEMGDQGLALSGSLSGLYGAVGDAFFWNGLKPMVSALAVMLFFWQPGFWAPLFLLCAYNIVHLGMRYTIYLHGLHRGIGVIETINSWHLPGFRNAMEFVTSASLAATAFLLVDYFALAGQKYRSFSFLLLLLLLAVMGWRRRELGEGQPRLGESLILGGVAVLLSLLFFHT
ncbi:MAG: PTS system mannose/fructose/sorbose family transporter subunit IID [Deltaproteobacteria bacterium]|nr:PTS system mannose/fructose/sorbose family transporter subunit IID [Deltaproteobacteria bacterium]